MLENATDALSTCLETTIMEQIPNLPDAEDWPKDKDGEPLPLPAVYLAIRMEQENLTAPLIAKATGFTPNTVYRVCRGEKPLSDNFIQALSEMTNIGKVELVSIRAVQSLNDMLVE